MNSRVLPLVFATALFASPSIWARESSAPVEGLHSATPRVHALVGADIVVSPQKRISDGVIVLRDGLIEYVGDQPNIPADARVWDLKGKTLYPAFIDAYSHYGMPEGLKPSKRGGPPSNPVATPSQAGPSYWNPLVTPERDIALHFKAGVKDAEKLHDLGFGSVATFPGRGIFRGQGAVVSLNGKPINQAAIASQSAQHIAFELARRSDTGASSYPTSLMGCIALIRQAFYDAQWQAKMETAYRKRPDKIERPTLDAALSSMQALASGGQIALFQAWDELDYQRIAGIADEFSIEYAILGNGFEYRRSGILEDMGATFILPLSFPKTPRVERVDAALDFSLEQLQHWDFAPSNPAFLESKGIEFCLTSHFLPDPGKDFWKSLRTAIKRGLSEETALASLTTNPARLYGLEDRLGALEPGKIANIIVADSDLFSDEKAKIESMWIDGDPIEKKAARQLDLEGEWTFEWDGAPGFPKGTIEGSPSKWTLVVGETKIPLAVSEMEALALVDQNILSIEEEGLARLQASVIDDRLQGSGQLANGTPFSWRGERAATSIEESGETEGAEKANKPDSIPELEFARYPAGAFGVAERATPETLLIRNATVWTAGSEGTLQNADVLIKQGRIAKIGSNLKVPKNALEIDANGKHVTPGLIDCHSHMAMSRGVNEAGSATTVEVRARDIINPVNINVYRQLAGGLTTANLLHGSANPMGGQSQVIKLRWGEDADAFVFKGARPGVKFALGENVKQSNWGDRYTTRYPQTRMGVEQFMRSQFRAAEDYERRWKDFEAGRELAPPRKNIRMEATLEILKANRDVHIHSYRQDEILMFVRLAQSLGLKVASFQHILEGYKVADAMVEINAGGSTFSDWWAYKFEVFDAIAYNGAMMHRQGVLTSFNSDDAELATRMNTEAAKAVKYGQLSEEEALQFVTLNPAIQLGIEDRVGSLEVGKDADFVIWNDHPLSTYAAVEQTWIDGIKRFDRDEHLERMQADAAEREGLVQKALKLRMKDLKLNPPAKKPDPSPPPVAMHFQGLSNAHGHAHAHDHDSHWEWIYHDGTVHYSCSGLEEEGH